MKNFMQSLLAGMGLFILPTFAVMADPGPGTNSLGNQLAAGATHWYEKAAVTVGPVDPAAKGGLVLQAGSFLYLDGDSTLHKYQMNAHVLLGSALLKTKGDLAQALKSGGVESMTLVVPVKNLKSRESGLDDNAYKALNEKENPNIKFVLESETLKGTALTAKGTLVIAGAAAPVTLSAEAAVTGDLVRLKGVQKLKMSDFKVKPPSISLLVTSIDCTDEISIHYDVVFAPASK
jgi:hypothetical protein